MTKEMGPVYSVLHMLFMNLIKLSTFVLSQKCYTLCKCFLFYIAIVMYFQNIERLRIKNSDHSYSWQSVALNRMLFKLESQ